MATVPNDIVEEKSPIADAILKKQPLVCWYTVRHDNNPDQYWLETQAAYPKANLAFLRRLLYHPASFLLVPLLSSSGKEVTVVVLFDELSVKVFNQNIADAMADVLPILYEQVFGRPDAETAGPQYQTL